MEMQLSNRPAGGRPAAGEFSGKRVLVTGGTKGIGEAIVRRLREAGAMVFATARSAPARDAAADLFLAADLRTAAGAASVAGQALERLGGIDILVNNVGGASAPGGGHAALSDDHWRDALEANLMAAVRLDRALLPAMLDQGS